MTSNCTCNKGFPVISEIQTMDTNSFLASHCCSYCGSYLFDTDLKPGEQVIATNNIENCEGGYTIPKGRLLRITAFTDISLLSTIGFLFSGLLAAGAFSPEGFAAVWDIKKGFDLNEKG